jgi:hypothetical protein
LSFAVHKGIQLDCIVVVYLLLLFIITICPK